jgi:hypothetical protein
MRQSVIEAVANVAAGLLLVEATQIVGFPMLRLQASPG